MTEVSTSSGGRVEPVITPSAEASSVTEVASSAVPHAASIGLQNAPPGHAGPDTATALEGSPSEGPAGHLPTLVIRSWTDRALPVLLSSLVTMALIGPAFWALASREPRPVATVDLQNLVEAAQGRQIAAFRATHGAHAVPDASATQAAVDDTARFARELSVAVDALGQSCRCVLVNKAAILNTGSVVDYTDTLRTRFGLNQKFDQPAGATK